MIDNDEVKIFHFQNNEIRALNTDGQLYFSLTDACKILKIKKKRGKSKHD